MVAENNYNKKSCRITMMKTRAITNNMTRNTSHITASVILNYVCMYASDRRQGGNTIIHGVPCRGKGVSFWFDSSQDCCASGCD